MSEVKFHVLVPSYNCFEWIGRCLNSIAFQQYMNFDVVVIDDASTDLRQPEFIWGYCETMGWDVVVRDENLKCPANIALGIQQMRSDPDDVILIVDGDDFLPHDKVLSRLNEVYTDPNVWLTYGNYISHPENTGQTPASAYTRRSINDRNYRYEMSLFNHPLSFRHHLWKHVPWSEMQYDDGTWFPVGYDRSIMVPMLELAGEQHFRFLNETLYAYNAVNPLSDNNVRLEEALEVQRIIGSRERLPPL